MTNKAKEPVSPSKKKYSEMTCGYVMPISDTTEYRVGHWVDIKSILDEVTSDIGFKDSRIVSTGLDVSTIHKRIVNNIFNDDIIICDVSSRNPNVMFELGMRIAFDKPVVIIKDDETPYCFDSGTIEHIEYPKDMRYNEMGSFKSHLKSKIEKTIESFISSPDESPILNSFGSFSIKKPDLPQMSEGEEYRSDIQEIKQMMFNIISENERYNFESRRKAKTERSSSPFKEYIPREILGNKSPQEMMSLLKEFSNISLYSSDSGGFTIVSPDETELRMAVRKILRNQNPN